MNNCICPNVQYTFHYSDKGLSHIRYNLKRYKKMLKSYFVEADQRIVEILVYCLGKGEGGLQSTQGRRKIVYVVRRIKFKTADL